MWLIYILFALLIFYFPSAELGAYIARETDLFKVPTPLPMEDALLALLCLAVAYSVVAGLYRWIERHAGAEKEGV